MVIIGNFKGILLCIVLLINNAFSLFAQKQNGFVIKGKIQGVKENTTLYLVTHSDKNDAIFDTVGTTNVNHGTFKFNGITTYEGKIYWIHISNLKHLQTDPSARGHLIRVLVENRRTITIDANLNDLTTLGVRVQGSPAHDDYFEFYKYDQNQLSSYKEQQAEATRRFLTNDKDSFTYVIESKRILEQYELERKRRIENWVRNHRNSLFAPWVIISNSEGQNEWAANNYRKLTLEARQSYFGHQLKNYIEMDQKTAIGVVAPDFVLRTSTGYTTSLKQITEQGKYTIIDFWASWCKPCIASFRMMKDLYAKYHTEGLNIVSYSIDKKKESWQKALTAYDLPWFNTIDTMDWARKTYGVEKVPWCYILDNKGRILVRNIHSSQLFQKITELMKDSKPVQVFDKKGS